MVKHLYVCLIICAFSVSCNKDSQDIQKEEEYKDEDVNPTTRPSNVRARGSNDAQGMGMDE